MGQTSVKVATSLVRPAFLNLIAAIALMKITCLITPAIIFAQLIIISLKTPALPAIRLVSRVMGLSTTIAPLAITHISYIKINAFLIVQQGISRIIPLFNA